MIDFYLKKGDTLPAVSAQFTDSDDIPINISGCNVDFNYKLRTSGGAVTSRSAVITSAVSGTAQYPWVSGDTSTPGLYMGEFVVTFTNGKQMTFPEGGSLVYQIIDEIA